MKQTCLRKAWYVTDDGMYVTNYPPGKVFLEKGDRCVACSPTPNEWTDADAMLISAAPELLAACKALLGIDMPSAGKPGHIDYSNAVLMAQDAIAKAGPKRKMKTKKV